MLTSGEGRRSSRSPFYARAVILSSYIFFVWKIYVSTGAHLDILFSEVETGGALNLNLNHEKYH